MTRPTSLPPAYFDAVYAAQEDPWRFETSAYEQAKYAATIAALPRASFASAFEIGCSIGVLTAALAPRCAALLSVDVSSVALARARLRLAASPQVQLRQMQVPQVFPAGLFDLVVMSEVGYYWNAADLALASARISQALLHQGVLLLVHWTPAVADYPLTGDAVHAHFLALCGAGQAFRHLSGSRQDTYRIDVLERVAAPAAS